jgi:hypothetical protein
LIKGTRKESKLALDYILVVQFRGQLLLTSFNTNFSQRIYKVEINPFIFERDDYKIDRIFFLQRSSSITIQQISFDSKVKDVNMKMADTNSSTIRFFAKHST